MLPAVLFFLVVVTIVFWSWLAVIPSASYVAGYIKNPAAAAPNSDWPRWFLGLPVWYWFFIFFPVIYWLFFLASCTQRGRMNARATRLTKTLCRFLEIRPVVHRE